MCEMPGIDTYTGCTVMEQFNFLYENYPVIKPMIRSYREELICEVMDQKRDSSKNENSELGVRVQVSLGTGNPTANQALEHMMVVKAIDEGFLDEDFFRGTSDRQELIRKVTCYHRVNADFGIFTSWLDMMSPGDQKLLRPYLMRQKSVADLAADMGIDYRSMVKRMYRLKKKLGNSVEPKLSGEKKGE